METGDTIVKIDITPLVDQQKITNELLIVNAGFVFALLVALAFHLVLGRGFKK